MAGTRAARRGQTSCSLLWTISGLNWGVTVMTGMRLDTIRVWDLDTHFRDTVPDVVTLPQQFKAQGYRCESIGKIYHNTLPDDQSWSVPGHHIKGYPYDPDAVYRDDGQVQYLEQRKAAITADGKQGRYIDPLGEWYLKAGAYEMPDVDDDAYYDGAQTTVAIGRLKELGRAGTPFFFGIGYYRPHLPFNVPRKYWDKYDRASIPMAENNFPPRNAPIMALNTLRELRGYTDFRAVPHPCDGGLAEGEARVLKHGYLASVSYVDAQAGRLMACLEEEGMADRTIVVLWGDNGWKLGEHRSWCKMTNFETDTRVPLIIRAPGCGVKPGVRTQLVECLDVYPTLCELAGLPAPAGVEGGSMVPLLRDQGHAGKQEAFSQFLRSGIWRCPDGRDYMGYTVRTNEYRYVEWFDWERKEHVASELYDHRTDPGEDTNCVDDAGYAEARKELAARLRRVTGIRG